MTVTQATILHLHVQYNMYNVHTRTCILLNASIGGKLSDMYSTCVSIHTCTCTCIIVHVLVGVPSILW